MGPIQDRDLDRQVAQFRRNRPSAQAEGAAVLLDLVNQAADVLQSIEDRAAATEARAQYLAHQAAEQLQSAEFSNSGDAVVATSSRVRSQGCQCPGQRS